MTETNLDRVGWAVIVQAPGTDDLESDGLDGWFDSKAEAQAAFESWCRRYPDYAISLVSVEQIRFPGTFGARRGGPTITARADHALVGIS